MDFNIASKEQKVLAQDVMKKEVISVLPETTIKEVARIMVENKISALPVVNRFNEILGVVSESDLINKVVKPHEPGITTLLFHAAIMPSDEVVGYRKAMSRWNAQTAAEAMTSPAICVDKNESIETVGRIMLDDKVKRVFVTEEGHLAGVISRSAFVEMLLK